MLHQKTRRTLLRKRTCTRVVVALALIATLAVTGAVTPQTAQAACASSTKSVGGSFVGEDGRRLSGMVGIALFDAGGNPINAVGCPKQPGDDGVSGYTFYTPINSYGGGCCFSLPAAGAPANDTSWANRWQIDGLPSNTAYVWAEAYPKSSANNATDYSHYGGAMRRAVPADLSIDVRLPLACAYGGSTGTMAGWVRRNGAAATVQSIVAFSREAEGTGQILGFVASNDANRPDGSFTIPSLASNQTYAFQITVVDGSSYYFEHDYGVGAPIAPCATTWRQLDLQPNGLAVSLDGVASGPGAADAGNGGTVFFRGQDGALWYRQVTINAPAGYLGGYMLDEPDVSTWGGGRLDIVARGGDNAVWHRWYSGGQWGPWERLGGTTFYAPTIVSTGVGQVDVFATGSDGQLWQDHWTGSGWTGWYPLGGGLTAAPDAASAAPGRLDIVARGGDGAVWHRYFTGTWSPWLSLGGVTNGGPTAASDGTGRLDVAARGTDDVVYRKSYNNGWGAWTSTGGVSDVDPDLMARGTVTTIVARGRDDWQIYRNQRTSPGGAFTGWVPVAG